MKLFAWIRFCREAEQKGKAALRAAEEARAKEEEKRAKEEEEIRLAFEKVIIFPGSKQEFEDFIGCGCEIIDTEELDKGVHLGPEGEIGRCDNQAFRVKNKMVANNIIAIINAAPYSWYRLGDDEGYYGLPVRKK